MIVHHRHRKTGPQHPLTTLRCRTHGHAFTLYPPGYAPYRRQPVMKLAADGKPILGEEERYRREFGGTVFEAALEAKHDRPRQANVTQHLPKKPSGTRGRHLQLGARIVGVAHNLSDRLRLTIATILRVSTLQLREGSRAAGQRGIAKAVCAVLQGMIGGPRRAWHLLVCGHLSGNWGEPLYWDAQRQLLERSSFVPATTVS